MICFFRFCLVFPLSFTPPPPLQLQLQYFANMVKQKTLDAKRSDVLPRVSVELFPLPTAETAKRPSSNGGKTKERTAIEGNAAARTKRFSASAVC